MFFQSGPVQVALGVSTAAALLCGALGVFTLMRRQAFAGHALADVASAGGAAGLLFGVSPFLGFLVCGVAGVGALEVLQARRQAARDEAAGILLGAGLGITALLLHLCLTHKGTNGAVQSVMFGAMFTLSPSTVIWAWITAAGCLLLGGFIIRPLLLASLDPDLARVCAVPVRLLSLLFLALLALGVTVAAMTVGAILATALLVGPAATALQWASSVRSAVLLSMALGVVACWGGIMLAYWSYGWMPGHVWPVSFFIVALLLVMYLLSVGRRLR